jgi:hypothetical protein
MPAEYMFGTGPGHLPRRANAIAKRHGAYVVNFVDASCECGHGCRPHACKKAKRHWLCCPHLGEVESRRIASAVMADLRATKVAT